METKKVNLTAAEQLAAKKAAFEAAMAAYEAAQTELGLLALKETVCNAINACADEDAVCTTLFAAIKENFPAKVSTFATLQEVFPVLMNVTVKRSGSKNKTVTAKNGSESRSAIIKRIAVNPVSKQVISDALLAVYPEMTNEHITQHLSKYCKKDGENYIAK